MKQETDQRREDMEEEEKIAMMMISSSSRSSKTTTSSPPHDEPITSSNWKLYQNPLYNQQPHPHHRGNNTRFPHRPLRPLSSARKVAASFWDLGSFRPASTERPGKDDTEAQIDELRAKLERERRARLKLEYSNKKLAKELGEERSGREALERVCEKLAKEFSFSCDRASIDRMKREIEEEREMLRMAEVVRKEKILVKLAETAKVFLEEKTSQLEEANNSSTRDEDDVERKKSILGNLPTALTAPMPGKPVKRLALVEKQPSWTQDKAINYTGDRHTTPMAVQRRLSPLPEPENPHIRRGIEGSVEFPRVVRAIGSKGRSWGAKKIDCQKAHIRILLKQGSPVRSTENNNLIPGL